MLGQNLRLDSFNKKAEPHEKSGFIWFTFYNKLISTFFATWPIPPLNV